MPCSELITDAPSLLRSPLCRGTSFSGIVPAPDDAELELCPVFQCHVPRAAVVDGGADFFVQTVPPCDLVSPTVFRFLSDGRVVSVACSEMRRESRTEVHRAAVPVGTRPDIASLGAGKERGSAGGADKGPAGIMPENFPNLVAHINLQIPEAERITNRENPKRPGQGSL